MFDLSRYALVADLSEEQRHQVLDRHRMVRFMAGRPLLREQEGGDCLFLFCRGIA